MVKSIESFVDSLSIVDSWIEAKRRYIESSDMFAFSRVEMHAAYELSRVGVQMVYVIGKGKVNYSSKEINSLFYFNCMVIHDFFKKEKDGNEVKAIPIDRIKEIKLVQLVSLE